MPSMSSSVKQTSLTLSASSPLRLEEVTVQAEAAENVQLDCVSLDIYAGEWIYITGVNGSGKSTLARLIAGIYTGWTSGRMDRGFAGMQTAPIVLQRPQAQLFGETPREEVQFALEWHSVPADRMDGIVRRTLQAVGLLDVADLRWEQLSGGQMQLAAVAAAVASDSPLLVFDEATSMLDDVHRHAVMRLARERQRCGTTVVWVTQRLDEIHADDRTIALRVGQLIFDGDGRTFLYGEQGAESPCVRCGLRLPYMAEMALALQRDGCLAEPLPVSDDEWQQVFDQPLEGRNAAVRENTVAATGTTTADSHSLADDARQDIACGKHDFNHRFGKLEKGELVAEGLQSAAKIDRLVFPAGTLTLIVGPNGAGKSWLLEKLAGLRPADGADIWFNGEPLWVLGRKRTGAGGQRLNEQALRQYGYAVQEPEQGMFMRTLAEEIAYSQRPYVGSGKDMDVRLQRSRDEALAAVGWDHAWLSRDPLRMSGGERRRAALAALYATSAEWLLLDEPTAGLDREGHDRIAEHLVKLKQAGRGIVMVSHDLEWALPLADHVLLVSRDRSLQRCRPEDLISDPGRLEQAGLQAPLWMRTAAAFGTAEEGMWRNPSWLAQAIASEQAMGGRTPLGRVSLHDELDNQRLSRVDPKNMQPTSRKHFEHESDFSSEQGLSRVDSKNMPLTSRNHSERKLDISSGQRLSKFDPRAVWLGYVLLSIGLFSLSTWVGLLAGIVLVLFILRIARIPLRRWKGIIFGYSIFGLAFAVLLSIRITSGNVFYLGWDSQKFANTLFPFARTLTVLLIGLGVVLAMTPLSLRRTLVQIVPGKRQIPAWWQRIVLTVTLTIRFVPVLLAEWERFGRIFISRGKVSKRTPRAVIRKLRDIALPMLLALFRLADEVAIALESRGVRKDARPTRGARLSWRMRDSILAGAAGLVSALMLWLD